MPTSPIVIADVLNLFEYEKVRDERRQRVLALKRARRVAVGRHLSFLFESRETVLFQIQEMCRAERIAAEDKVQEEIDVYNALLPGPSELSATMFIEIEDMARIKPTLDRLAGIDRGQCVWLQIGREFAVPGQFEAGHSDEEKGKLAAVHFVRFGFSAEAIDAFRASDVDLVVDHPATRARTRLTPETKAELLTDLAA